MHHAAHENCFIANSVKTEVKVTKILFSPTRFSRLSSCLFEDSGP